MPIDPLLAQQGQNVAVLQPLDLVGAYSKAQGLRRQQQQLTLADLGLAEQQRGVMQQQAAESALRNAVTPQGTIDYGQAQEVLARTGNLGGLAALGKVQGTLAQTEETQAQAQERRLKAHEIGTEMAHGAMRAVQQNPSLYEAVLEQLYQQFQAMGLTEQAQGLQQFYAQNPVYDKTVVDAKVATTGNERLRLQELTATRLGTTPIYGTMGGKDVVAQLSPQGGAVVAQTPGFTPTPTGTVKVDTGTGTQLRGRSGELLTPEIPKDVRTPEREKKLGETEGATQGQLLTNAKQAERGLATITQKQTALLKPGGEIDRAIALSPAAGVYQGYNPLALQRRENLKAAIKRIGANIGLEELQSLKASGTTLGQVTEAEHDLLRSQLAAMDIAQDPATLKQQLLDLKGILQERQARRREAFQTDFGHIDLSKPVGTSPNAVTKSPYGGKPVESLTDDQAREELRFLEQRMRQKGGR